MAIDGLSPCCTRASSAMVLTLHDIYLCVFHKDGVQLYARILKIENIKLSINFPKLVQHDKGWHVINLWISTFCWKDIQHNNIDTYIPLLTMCYVALNEDFRSDFSERICFQNVDFCGAIWKCKITFQNIILFKMNYIFWMLSSWKPSDAFMGQ